MILVRFVSLFFFFLNDTATTEIYTYCHTLSLHDALPIYVELREVRRDALRRRPPVPPDGRPRRPGDRVGHRGRAAALSPSQSARATAGSSAEIGRAHV